ncbi:MAG: hypothetical protein U0586_01220 [Candidatus Brocadiaceae bacterium]
MSNDIERQKRLSKRVLMQGESTHAEQGTSSQAHMASQRLVYPFILGAIAGLSILVIVWISTGFSKWAIMLPFIGGISSIAIKMILQKNKT